MAPGPPAISLGAAGRAHALARLFAITRIAIGATLVLAPSVTSSWAGPPARRPGIQLITRAAGIRDLMVGWRTVQALDRRAPVRRLLVDGAVADAVDLGATVAAWSHLPRLARLGLLASGASAVAVGIWLASTLD